MTEPWLERWQEGRIGWHESDGNRNLRKYWTANTRRVLVPFCGKTPDLLWLEELGNEVVGVELSDLAARDFFIENDVEFDTARHRDMTCFSAVNRNIRIVCGDYLSYSGETFDACYDRGALIALPRDLRVPYAAHTSSLLAAGAYHCLICVEYDQSMLQGPPFAVFDDEVRSYWPDMQRVGDCEDIQNAAPKFREAGVQSMREVVWLGDGSTGGRS